MDIPLLQPICSQQEKPRTITSVGVFPAYCKLFISLFDINHHPTVIIKNVSRHCQTSLKGQNFPWPRSTIKNRSFFFSNLFTFNRIFSIYFESNTDFLIKYLLLNFESNFLHSVKVLSKFREF